ncbi:MAG: PIG-L family deacetylase [Pseudomonadota bacterium]
MSDNFISSSKLSLLKYLLAGVLLLLSLGVLILNWMFEEESPTFITSISHHTGAKSMLAVLAHPDDELLVTGLLIQAAEDPGIRTAVITATKGEAGNPLPQISRMQDLGWVRKAEALKNTWALGVEHHTVLDFPDGGLIQTPRSAITDVIRSAMLEHKPDLLVTFWPESGFSDHADHKRIGLIAETLANEFKNSPVDGYAGPHKIAYPLAPRRMMNYFAGDTGKEVVANQPLANYSQDGEAWAKLRGWEIHASQSDYVWNAYGFPAWFVHALYDKEYYLVLESDEIPIRYCFDKVQLIDGF